MKKTDLLILFAFLFSAVACQGSVLKFHDWVHEGDILNIDNVTLRFGLSNNLETIRVEYGDEMSWIIGEGICQANARMSICFNGSYFNPITDERKANVKVTFFSPNLVIERKSDKTTVNIGDEIKFDSKIYNLGDFAADKFSYTDSFPSDFEINAVSGDCGAGENNTIIYNGILDKNERISCRYSVTPKKELDVKLEAQVDYFDGYKDIKNFSSLINIKASPLFTMEGWAVENIGNSTKEKFLYTPLSKAEIKAGEEIRLEINLSNIITQKLNFEEFRIKFPKEVIVIKSNMIKLSEGYHWSGKLESNESETFYFFIKPTEGGNFEIIYDTRLEKEDKEFILNDNKIDFEVEQEILDLTSSLESKNSFDPGTEIFLAFWAENPNNFTAAENITIKITSTLFNVSDIEMPMIGTNKKKLLYKTSLLAPLGSKTYAITVEAKYTTKYGASKTAKKTWKVTVGSPSELNIKKTLSKSSVTEEEDIKVTVEVTNSRKSPMYHIKLSEIFPEGLARNGKTTATIDFLDTGETQKAYIYSITAPKVKKDTSISINTTATYYEDDSDEIKEKNQISLIKALTIRINPKKISLTISKTADFTSIDLGEIIKIKYEIENEDEETAYDIYFKFGNSENIDHIGEYDYHLQRIEPGERVSFQKEIIRPKKASRYSTGTTMVFYEDVDGNSFNSTVGNLNIDVKDRNINGPAILIKKIFGKTALRIGEVINVTLSAENVGDEGADITIVDGSKQFTTYVDGKYEKNISYKFVAGIDEPTYEVYGFYEFQGKEYRAYNKAKSITIKEGNYVTETIKDDATNETVTISEEDDNEKLNKSLIDMILRWLGKIGSFFTKE